MPPDAHLSDVLDVQPVVLDRCAIAGPERNTVEPVEAAESGASPLAFDELQVGAVQAAEDLLPGAHVQETQRVRGRLFVAPVSPHPGLLVVANPPATLIPALAAVGEGVIVEGTRGVEDISQCRPLALVGVETLAVGAEHLLPPLLGFDVALDCRCRDIARRANVVGPRPHVRQARPKFGKLLAQLVGREAFEPVHDLVRRKRGWEGTEQMHVVGSHCEVENLPTQVFCLLSEELAETHGNPSHQDRSTVLRYPDEVITDVVGRVSCSFGVHNLTIPQKGGGPNSPLR
jgi:hypothetical protein